jgi:hypothetical protein
VTDIVTWERSQFNTVSTVLRKAWLDKTVKLLNN